MRTWIRTDDDELVNLDCVNRIYREDRGPDYPKGFLVMVQSMDEEIIIRSCKTQKAANDYIDELHKMLMPEATE